MKPIAIVAAAVCIGAPAAACARDITLADLRHEVSISGPKFSPDGKKIAFVKSVQDFAKNRFDDDVILADVSSGATRTLTFERQDISNVRWSPSGDRLAFIADAGTGDDSESEIFVMPMDGGDARQITTCDNGVQEFEWRPDGRAIAFVTQDDAPDSTPGHDAFEVGDQDYKATAAALPSHLWVVPASGGTARRLTKGTWSLSTTAGGGSFGISWSGDGRRIAITQLPNAVYGDSDDATVATVDAKSGAVTELPGQRKHLVGATFAPAGDTLVMDWFRHGTFNSNASLVIADAVSGRQSELAPGFDHNVDWAQWTLDSRAVLAGAEDGALTELWRLGLDGSRQRYDLGGVNFANDADVTNGGAVAFVGTEAEHPDELYYAASPNAAPRRLTDYNAWADSLTLGAQRELTWTGPGGYHEDGIVTLPPEFSPLKKYPLALVVHGGPQGASELSFGSLEQLFAARGYV
ncbi:MAG TPA: DPP IV N-terminal domain-containing protein, partial [Candidatus Eremiobacteraceae bacterium]|nr:DPP IV N-terminal domain-containing protein [Candidatus Eremiobacteraceae bacterium]